MTQVPPHPSDADCLNTLLDALVSGKRAPDADSASDDDAFAATHVHRLVSGDAAADVSATPSEHTLDNIWRTVMQTPASASQPLDHGHPPTSARQRARLSAIPEGPRPSRFQTMLSVSAVAAMLVVMIAAAWIGRGWGTGPDTPGQGRYAAQPLNQGTPEATGWTATAPFSPEAWMSPISREECTGQPMSSSEYVEIIRSDIDISGRAYEIAGPPAPETAAEVVDAARRYYACAANDSAPLPPEESRTNRARSMTTDAYLWASANTVSGNEAAQHREADPAWKELEAHFRSQPTSSYRTVMESEAPQYVQDVWERRLELAATPNVSFGGASGEDFIYARGLPYGIDVVNPNLVVELADGRMAIPVTTIYWADDPDIAWLDEIPSETFLLYILAEEDGQWLLDEEILVCVEGCEQPGTPSASPAPGTNETASIPAATYVHPHPAMCIVEPLTVDEVMAMVTGEVATPAVSTPVPIPEMNEATYEELRSLLDQYLSCSIAGDPFRLWAISSPDAIWTQLAAISGLWMPEARIRQMLEEMQADINATSESSRSFNWTPAGNPAIPAMPDEFDPSLAHIDEDGRAHVTVVWVTRDGEPPSEEDGYPIGAEGGVSEMIFIWDANQGRWLIDVTP